MKTPLASSLALGLALLSCCLVGCGSASASGKAEADTGKKDPFAVEGESAWAMNGEGAEDDVPDAPAKKKSTPAASASGTAKPAAAPTAASEPALLGARHDLYLGKGAPTPCKCLAVVAGSANAAGLLWSGARPTLDASSQLAIAIGSDEVPCDQEASSASYQGYVRDGEHVVVRVEAAKPGRPVTHGAIIPKPGQGGQIFIEGSKGSPYGRGPANEARCPITPSR
ncbi:MAG TPA: hypothetical protein VLC09_05145 [Polyangiaceae bacterium]|nr:hypothetical protein [Polyangiaceae bacterium]